MLSVTPAEFTPKVHVGVTYRVCVPFADCLAIVEKGELHAFSRVLRSVSVCGTLTYFTVMVTYAALLFLVDFCVV